jgi:hypothetical protein
MYTRIGSCAMDSDKAKQYCLSNSTASVRQQLLLTSDLENVSSCNSK